MKFKVLLFIVMFMFGSKVKAQPSTNYWFEGNIYMNQTDKEKRYPYLPVYLSLKDSPDEIIAVGMSNSVGTISFKGIPIDISKDYILSLPFRNNVIRYRFHGIQNPTFKTGNVSIHMKLDEDIPNYYTTKKFEINENVYSLNFIDWVLRDNSISYDNNSFIDKNKQLGFRIFVNGMMMPDDKLQTLLRQLTMDMVKKVSFIYLNDNEYFVGAIDIRLSIGNVPSISETTFTLNKISF